MVEYLNELKIYLEKGTIIYIVFLFPKIVDTICNVDGINYFFVVEEIIFKCRSPPFNQFEKNKLIGGN